MELSIVLNCAICELNSIWFHYLTIKIIKKIISFDYILDSEWGYKYNDDVVFNSVSINIFS